VFFVTLFKGIYRLAKKSQQPTGNDGAKSDTNNTGNLSEEQLGSRLDSLERQLKSRRKDEVDSERRQGDSAGFSAALRLSTDFVVAILVGAGVGWAIDRFVGTAPWAMIVFLLLGFGAGVLNVMRSAGLVAENRALRPGPTADTKERKIDN